MYSVIDLKASKTIAENNNPNESNEDFIASPKGTKPFPIKKKIRPIAKRHPTLIVSIPYEICHLMGIKNGDSFNMYCEIKENKIVLDKIV